jgi:hypothetical protein
MYVFIKYIINVFSKLNLKILKYKEINMQTRGARFIVLDNKDSLRELINFMEADEHPGMVNVRLFLDDETQRVTLSYNFEYPVYSHYMPKEVPETFGQICRMLSFCRGNSGEELGVLIHSSPLLLSKAGHLKETAQSLSETSEIFLKFTTQINGNIMSAVVPNLAMLNSLDTQRPLLDELNFIAQRFNSLKTFILGSETFTRYARDMYLLGVNGALRLTEPPLRVLRALFDIRFQQSSMFYEISEMSPEGMPVFSNGRVRKLFPSLSQALDLEPPYTQDIGTRIRHTQERQRRIETILLQLFNFRISTLTHSQFVKYMLPLFSARITAEVFYKQLCDQERRGDYPRVVCDPYSIRLLKAAIKTDTSLLIYITMKSPYKFPDAALPLDYRIKRVALSDCNDTVAELTEKYNDMHVALWEYKEMEKRAPVEARSIEGIKRRQQLLCNLAESCNGLTKEHIETIGNYWKECIELFKCTQTENEVKMCVPNPALSNLLLQSKNMTEAIIRITEAIYELKSFMKVIGTAPLELFANGLLPLEQSYFIMLCHEMYRNIDIIDACVVSLFDPALELNKYLTQLLRTREEFLSCKDGEEEETRADVAETEEERNARRLDELETNLICITVGLQMAFDACVRDRGCSPDQILYIAEHIVKQVRVHEEICKLHREAASMVVFEQRPALDDMFQFRVVEVSPAERTNESNEPRLVLKPSFKADDMFQLRVVEVLPEEQTNEPHGEQTNEPSEPQSDATDSVI